MHTENPKHPVENLKKIWNTYNLLQYLMINGHDRETTT